ncbi:MAG: ferredoxin family protein [Promethearchaeota archaeon]
MPKIKVDMDKCTGCGTCVDVCPSGVYELDDAAGKTKVIAEDECIECLACQDQCPEGAIEVETD